MGEVLQRKARLFQHVGSYGRFSGFVVLFQDAAVLLQLIINLFKQIMGAVTVLLVVVG
jgi:hypothetical protein